MITLAVGFVVGVLAGFGGAVWYVTSYDSHY